MKPTLTLTFDDGWGHSYTMRVDVEPHVARRVQRCPPPPPPELLVGHTAESRLSFVVEAIEARELRKGLFVGEARRLGQLLAERMEDAEGWHDASRIGPAEEELKG